MQAVKFFSIPHSILILSGAILINGCSVSKPARVNPDHSAMERLTYLASDALAGRLPGSAGDSLARCYIQQEMKRNQLTLLFKEGFQEIPFTQSRYTGEHTSLIMRAQSFI